ncbi:hypothetical protein M8C21_020591, partial [Ambrosia artemisiifolia]
MTATIRFRKQREHETVDIQRALKTDQLSSMSTVDIHIQMPTPVTHMLKYG